MGESTPEVSDASIDLNQKSSVSEEIPDPEEIQATEEIRNISPLKKKSSKSKDSYKRKESILPNSKRNKDKRGSLLPWKKK